jgi:hypothetical protein
MSNSDLTMRPDPTICFIAVAGSATDGICPLCNRHGSVGKFYYECWCSEGMMIGKCPNCKDCGTLGTVCLECGDMIYMEEEEIGECPLCHDEGTRGNYCSECEDMSMVYE